MLPPLVTDAAATRQLEEAAAAAAGNEGAGAAAAALHGSTFDESMLDLMEAWDGGPASPKVAMSAGAQMKK